MKLIEPVIRNIKKYNKDMTFKSKFIYTKYYQELQIKDDEVLLESFNGLNFNGSMYYLLLELCKNDKYKRYKKYISLKADINIIKGVKQILKRALSEEEMENVEIVSRNSDLYCKILAEAKYLITNVTFPYYFMRKKGQIYLNTWHGTPLKGLGRNIKDKPDEIGNVQRNFMHATHLIYPNEYTFDIMRKDYMIEKYYNGEYIVSGYPRNEIFFDEQLKQEVRKKLGLENKKVAVYMPTYRDKEKEKKHDKQFYYIMHVLYEMEKLLSDDVIVFVKLHHYVSGRINFSDFKKIKPFPSEYETYEFLNIADCLITDYSSVMFDFANTEKKIILYCYDKEQYMNGRSIYFDIDTLPFPRANTAKELCEEIENIENYEKYEQFRNKYCNFDNRDISKNVCSYIFEGKKSSDIKIIDGKSYHNGKENVLIFAGELRKNGITSALKAMLNNVNLDDKNYAITFYAGRTESDKQTINELSEKIDYFPLIGEKNLRIKDAIYQYLYFRLNINTKLVNKNLSNIFKTEIHRVFPEMQFDYAIHYSGYERMIMHLFANMDAKKIIFTHNNLIEENKQKNNLHLPSLENAYDTFDNIVVIRESMKAEVEKNVKKVNSNKIVLVHNINDIDKIKEKSKDEVMFDKETYCNFKIEQIKEILEDEKVTKFINIARYSKEKGMERLISAFQKYRETNKNCYLIIIGGYGKNFDNILKFIEDNNVENVVIIKSLSNPYPILAKCDLFILSSYYEGLPMSIMEALILDKPVISTNISGPKEFLEKGYGLLVENSEEGLLQGMNSYKENGLKNLAKFDAEKFNKNALNELYKILKK